MAENSASKHMPFNSVDELVEYFDAGNDMSEYLDSMPEVHFDVDIKSRRYLIEIEAELLSKLTRIAREREVSTEDLVDSWLRERVEQA